MIILGERELYTDLELLYLLKYIEEESYRVNPSLIYIEDLDLLYFLKERGIFLLKVEQHKGWIIDTEYNIVLQDIILPKKEILLKEESLYWEYVNRYNIYNIEEILEEGE